MHDESYAYIASYPHGLRRLVVGAGKRVDCRLLAEKWLEDLAGHEQVSLSCHDRAVDTVRITIEGLVRISAGSMYTPVQFWSRHAMLMWEYYHRAMDAYTVRVHQCFPHEQPHQLFLATRRKRTGGNSMLSGDAIPITLRSAAGVFYCHDDLSGDRFHNVQTGSLQNTADIVAGSGTDAVDVPVILLPQPIARLAMRGRWPEIVLLGRWPGVEGWSWPPSEWIDARKGKHKQEEPAQNVAISADRLRKVAQSLKRWMPKIAQDGDDDDVMEAEQHIMWLDEVADSLCVSVKSRTGRATSFAASFALHCLLLSRKLRSKQNIASTLERHLISILPPAVRETLKVSMTTTCKVPSPSTMQQHQLVFDVAFMLFKRATLSRQAGARYIFADASEQGGRDWLIAKIQFVADSDLINMLEAMFALTADAERHHDTHGLEDDDGHSHAMNSSDDDPHEAEPELQPEVDRVRLNHLLSDCIQEHQCVPAEIGLGRASLEDKAAALAFAWFLETGFEHLPGILHSTVSLCTDMGTERGLADFAKVNLRSLLPPWLGNTLLGCDTEDADDDSEFMPWMFSKSLCIAGVLHIFSNALKDVNTALQGWSDVYDKLKVVEKLICNPRRMQRFISQCLRGTHMEHHEKKFQRRVNGLYDKRWVEVEQFCKRLQSIFIPLKLTFDAKKFKEQLVCEHSYMIEVDVMRFFLFVSIAT